MGYWNDLRASGVNLYERYCVSCKNKKNISLFPKHQKYKKSNVCFECLGEFKCITCKQLKKYEEFINKHKGALKSKTQCWDCFITIANARKRKAYAIRKKEGTLPPKSDRSKSKLTMVSHLWAKISSKNSSSKDSERSSQVNITNKEFKIWFANNYDDTCSYCGVSLQQYRSSIFLKKIRPHIKNFGIDRKDTKRGYELDNIAVACNFCNSVKGSFFSHDEFKEIAKKYIRKLYE
jgi:hypothetical protein